MFYNDSYFDGSNPEANRDDDGAIAPDKRALAPGEAPTAANETSFARGLNGIMIDVQGLRAIPTFRDFEFSVAPEPGAERFSMAPIESSITVRPGEGIGGSDRITIIWPEYAIQDEWLRVTMLPTSQTGLDRSDTFFFGNHVRLSDPATTDIDLLSAQLRAGSTDLRYDLDGDGRVNAFDRAYLLSVVLDSKVGDSNLDGLFNTEDMVQVFQIGQYEDNANQNSGWAAGDWNGDGDFDAADFVLAFQSGQYEQPAPVANCCRRGCGFCRR